MLLRRIILSMDFGDAIKAIKNGKRVKRANWGGYWYLPKELPVVKGNTVSEENSENVYFGHMIVAKLKQNYGDGWYAPAQPYMADMLADDWKIAEFKSGKLVN